MPSGWPRMAASTWSGVTSGLLAGAGPLDGRGECLLGLEGPAVGVDGHRPHLRRRAWCRRGRAGGHRHLGERDQLASVLAVGAATASRASARVAASSCAESGHLGLELHHPAHPFEVEPGGGEALDVAEAVEVLRR